MYIINMLKVKMPLFSIIWNFLSLVCLSKSPNCIRRAVLKSNFDTFWKEQIKLVQNLVNSKMNSKLYDYLH